MSSIVFGLVAMCIGLWGMVSYWWYVVDVVLAILPVILLCGGFIALMAGIKKTGIRTKIKVNNKAADEHTISE